MAQQAVAVSIERVNEKAAQSKDSEDSSESYPYTNE
jgi:hypothetical protein